MPEFSNQDLLQQRWQLREMAQGFRQAQILASIVCTECGEATMSTRVQTFRGQPYCIPCFETLTQKQHQSN